MAKKRRGRSGNIKAKEKKVEQKLFRLMPALPKLLRRVHKRIENIDWKQPKTFLANLEGDFKAFEQTLPGRERRIWRLVWFLFGKLVVQIQAEQIAHQMIADIKQSAATDVRYSLLLKLMHDTDKRVPFASLLVHALHGDPKTAWLQQCAPFDLLEQAEKETGEARATTVLRALHVTAEVVYKPYLLTLWCLSYIREGEKPPQAPGFGELVTQTHRRLTDYPGLVEPDAGWMRNSAAHNMPEYVIGEDAVVVWDKSHEPKKVRVDDLLEMVQRMYLISAITVVRVGQLYLFREFFVNTGLFKMFVGLMPLVFSRDESRMSAAEREIEQRVKSLMGPFEAFFSPQS
jgi:hypothetical protein